MNQLFWEMDGFRDVGSNVVGYRFATFIGIPHGDRLFAGFVKFYWAEARIVKFKNCKQKSATAE